MHVIIDNIGFLLQGVVVTIELTVLGYVGALLLGTMFAVFRVGPITPLRVIGSIYVEFFRNIPLLALLVLVIFGLPDAGVTIPLFASAAVCLALSGSAFVCEAMRGGINSVSVGQAEAARAIGLSFNQVLGHVILPQAFRAMVQPLVNVFIGVLLSSALAAAVGVPELTNRTQQLNLQYAEAVVCFLFAGAVYLLVALSAGAVGGRLERRLAIKR
ncbi:amino acid ABC transporter permease [Nocardioides panaciterrulae]|uniref:Glutamate transport system permease protein n=1 Tax=Nocardioides panaciterrulae TaxID=661492 RepID=A0A7Y9E4I1_9ACTN|nr:amino acid ABC transporter permease [Nocardioides panaciterrulae]NYD41096.1 glutamate transport system permease protein [Nocardioides panaciterrulae]